MLLFLYLESSQRRADILYVLLFLYLESSQRRADILYVLLFLYLESSQRRADLLYVLLFLYLESTQRRADILYVLLFLYLESSQRRADSAHVQSTGILPGYGEFGLSGEALGRRKSRSALVLIVVYFADFYAMHHFLPLNFVSLQHIIKSK